MFVHIQKMSENNQKQWLTQQVPTELACQSVDIAMVYAVRN